MKRLKKLAVALLAVAVAASLAVPAFAAGETYEITIENKATGHTYEAYQIFKGDLSDGVLSNIEWGSGVTAEGQAELGSAVVKANALTTEAEAAEFAKEVAPYLATVAGSVNQSADGKYVISGLSAGYYLIKDADTSLSGADDSYTSFILKVVGNVTARPKSDVPTFQKKVKDVNDSEDGVIDDNAWQDSADHDMGDAVPFQLTGTVAANYDAYDAYYFAFHDQECKGLTFDPDSVMVCVDGTLITSGYEVITNPAAHAGGFEGDCTFEVVFQNLKGIQAVKANSVITIEYTSTLNEDAVLGSAGNPNVAYLEYSNNPTQEWDGVGKPETGQSVEDKVIVFTYKVAANKVDENDKPLAGAGFTLYKKNASGEYEAVGSEVKGGEMTTFEWKGIDDGEYKIVETTTPDGYNTADPIEFTVAAEHDTEAVEPALTSLSGDMFTGSVEAGTVTADVVNQKGATLPSTGGMGTVAMYAVGAALLIGAGVVLVARRRAGSGE